MGDKWGGSLEKWTNKINNHALVLQIDAGLDGLLMWKQLFDKWGYDPEKEVADRLGQTRGSGLG